MDGASWSRRLALGAWVLALGGCNQSGQTGSPVADGPAPKYETPARFSPDSSSGGDTGGEGDGGNRPQFAGGDLMALLPSGQAVTAVSGRGVIVYDVAEPAKPGVIGELPMRATIRQLELDLDGSAPALIVHVDESVEVDEPAVPEAPTASVVSRLVRIDLSDPAAPVRVAQIDLEGDVWRFTRRGDHYLVLAQVREQVERVCGPQATIERAGPATIAMRVRDYALGADGFSLRDTIDLPANAPYAFATADAYFVAHDYYAHPGDEPALSFVTMDGDSLAEHGPIALDGRLVDVALSGGVLVTLTEREQDSSLQVFTLDAGGTAELRGRLALPAHMGSLELLAGAQRLLVDGSAQEPMPALLVDVSDPGQPVVAHQFPADVRQLVAVPQGLLGLGGSSTGHLVASLWALPASGTPQMLGRLDSRWPWYNREPEYAFHAVDSERGLLFTPAPIFEDAEGRAMRPGLGIIRFDTGGIRVDGEYPMHEEPYRPIASGPYVFSRGYQGLDVARLEEGATASTAEVGYAPFYEPPDVAQRTIAGREVTLRERATDGRFVVDVASEAGGEPAAIELDHIGDALVAVGDRAVVIGLRWDSECQYMEPEPALNDGRAFDRCAEYRGRGISVIDVSDEPRVVATFPVSNELDFDPIEGVTAETAWSGYFELADGRLAFPVDRWLRCSSYESCGALGVQASEGMASPGCNPQTQDCDELPAVETFVSGAKPGLLLYVLEDTGGEPALELAAQIDGRFQLPGEGPIDVGWQLLRNGDDLAFVREEPVYDANGNSVQNEHEDGIVRFYLDRIEVAEDGGLRALPSVNTPGRPVAWRGGDVYTLEPDYDDEGEVFVRAHRAALRDDAAHIEQSIELGTRFRDARAVGDRLLVVRGLTDECDEQPRSELFSVALGGGALERSGSLELPGAYWSLPYGPATDAEGHAVLRGGPLYYQGQLELDLGEDGTPSVVRYTDAPRL